MTNPVRYSDFELSEDELEWEYQPVCEQVGRMFGNDGRCFMTGDGRTIFEVCQMVARDSRRESSSCGTVHRYTFFDDSALVIGPHSWDYAGSHDAREEEECRMAKLRSINAFIDENDRIPAIDAQNIFERLLAKSLERLRTEPAYFSCLAEIDCYKLLR